MSRRPNLSAEHGYSMMAVMLVMLATSMLAGAAFSAVGGDIPFARASQDRKQAYAAAEAGIEYYLYQLARDNDYWTKCTGVPEIAPGQPAPINQADPVTRLWRSVAGAEARFSIELLPANGALACDSAAAEQTMLDMDSGTFRIRSTGESRGITRSIVATFRRSSFLDYLYFTDYETSDPATYTTATARANAAARCVQRRPARPTDGTCREITFPDHDKINGPLHTNDDLLTCGAPDFGRNPQDAIEISGTASDGWTGSGGSGCGGAPDFLGTVRWPAPLLTVPTSNDKLREVAADGGNVYYGQTNVEFTGTSMTVTHYDRVTGALRTDTGTALPGNGVIYVLQHPSLGCSRLNGPLEQDYSDSAGCAVLTVSGSYAKSMTLGSAADILIDGDLTRSGDPVLGLIAENFVRVKHDERGCPSASTCFRRQDYLVQAAILSLAHSFIVDNYSSGARLGTLRVEGAIAQRFRGPVGQFNTTTGETTRGYAKDYHYDNRLRYRSPPYFLDPVSAAWRIIRSNEQVPAAE